MVWEGICGLGVLQAVLGEPQALQGSALPQGPSQPRWGFVSQGRLPVKWMAPEALFDRIYTHQSDV